MLVIGTLSEKPLRFSELQGRVVGISQRMLTLTVRQLERDGLVTRTVHAEVPPRVEYALTDLGRTLLEPVILLATWALGHHEDVMLNRKAYDEAHPG
jgi:DNA-binding HxlR family transcriptional regulator